MPRASRIATFVPDEGGPLSPAEPKREKTADLSHGDILAANWDVIVVGAGLGGGIAGRRLAEAGLSVLFLESGYDQAHILGQPTEDAIHDPEARLRHGYWPAKVQAVVDGREMEIYGSMGSGVGGSSAFYAATLERPERHDLDDSPAIPHPTGGWPLGFDTFLPWFREAERLMAVCGEPDPLAPGPAPDLRPAPPLSPGDTLMMESFRASGLHPYRKHVGVRYVPGCTECFGRRCDRACKMDGRSAGVEPAVATGRAVVLDRCAVVAFRGSANAITHVEARRHGETLQISARCFVLAAGGLGSPRLLLASASEAWPAGCANSSRMAGMNLMFHLNEHLAIWPARRADFTGPVNTISIRDFYQRDGVRYGHLQSIGLDASYGDILMRLRENFDATARPLLRPARPFLRIPALGAAYLFGKARIFKGLLEDLPYRENRVVLNPADTTRVRFHYTIKPELAARRRAFRTMVKAGIGQRAFFLHNHVEFDIPHACGTLRFGTDPRHSVFDPACRAHDISNLYLSDASFMPTSMGINPSLTIVANAMRVAEGIVAQFHELEARPATA